MGRVYDIIFVIFGGNIPVYNNERNDIITGKKFRGKGHSNKN